MTDLLLAIVHHVLVFGLVTMLAVEGVLLREAVIAVGVGRVIWGGKGWAFYEANPFFWAKMAAFAAIGLLSLAPTRTFLRWGRLAKTDAAFQPPEAEVKRARLALRLQMGLVVVVLACAAAMARYPF